MKKKIILPHSGSSTRRTGFSSFPIPATIPKDFTLSFGIAKHNLAIGDLITPPAGEFSYLGQFTSGFYINNNSKIVDWGVIVSKFNTNSVGEYTRFLIKTMAADGSHLADINISFGTTLVSKDLVYPNTGGVIRYYIGVGETGISKQLYAGDMIFAGISAMTVDNSNGVSLWIRIEED